MKVITTCHYNRPQYTKRCIEHLSKCIDIENYLLVIRAEPENDEVIELLKGIDFCETDLQINPEKLGCTLNTGNCLFSGAEYSDYIIHVEDDILLSKDCLLFFEQFHDLDDDKLFNVTAFLKTAKEYDVNKTGQKEWFTPWGWATWRNRLTKTIIEGVWSKANEGESWDVKILTRITKKYNLEEKYPFVSRAQNIGAIGGIHVPNSIWHRSHQHSTCFIDRPTMYINPIEELKSCYPWPENPNLPFDNGGWFGENHEKFFNTLIHVKKPKVIMEIGSWYGLSTRYFLKASDAVVIAADHWKGSSEHKNFPNLANLYNQFISNCYEYKDRLIPMRENSSDAIAKVYDCGIIPDIIYIDASHHYEDVKKDFEDCLKYFPDSIIALDDLNWPGPNQLFREFMSDMVALAKYSVCTNGGVWSVCNRHKFGVWH